MYGNNTRDVLQVAGYSYDNQTFGAIFNVTDWDGVYPTDGEFLFLSLEC
jgi:hypothetical protein